MKFGSKPDYKPFPIEDKSFNKQSVKIDWKLYTVDEDAEISVGKYSGKTLSWIMENDENYLSWMYKEGLIASWGLIKLKQETVKVSSIYFYSESTGQKWVGIRECLVIGEIISSPFL